LSALLAALLAVHFGFSVVLLVSAALYTAAVLAWPARPERKPLIGKASYHSIP